MNYRLSKRKSSDKKEREGKARNKNFMGLKFCLEFV
jgi:hypothetical protein